MNALPSFALFSTAHVVTIFVVVVAMCIPSLFVKRLPSVMGAYLARLLAVMILLNEIFSIVISVYVYKNPFSNSLPFHLCGFAALLTSWMLWRKEYRSYEIAYFWAIGGSLPAMLTPDLALGFPHPTFVHFFFSHGLIILGVIYATIIFEFRPVLASVGKAILASLLLMVVVAPINLLLGSNYMYLCQKPLQNTLMDYFGSWPWYLLTLIGIGAMVFVLCYLPFIFVRKRETGTKI